MRPRASRFLRFPGALLALALVVAAGCPVPPGWAGDQADWAAVSAWVRELPALPEAAVRGTWSAPAPAIDGLFRSHESLERAVAGLATGEASAAAVDGDSMRSLAGRLGFVSWYRFRRGEVREAFDRDLTLLGLGVDLARGSRGLRSALAGSRGGSSAMPTAPSPPKGRAPSRDRWRC
ncbi:MAG: hypothetical protein HY815_01585 [Candidatus Riflebacteria bacterium]|nr:hypothetical protein [Candidatus Riflebacteria bacterium]